MKDFKFIARKVWNHYFPKRKWERGFRWTLDSHMDYTEDFSREIVLAQGNKTKTFVDGGAHTGMWAIQASRYFGEVIALEPGEGPRKTMKTNLRINKIDNVRIIPKALSIGVGREMFYQWPRGHMGDSLLQRPVTYTSDYGEGGKPIPVETVDIDSLRYKYPPSVIMLDVEGAEDKVIMGGLKTIWEYKPTLIIEVHRPENDSFIRTVLPGYSWETRIRHFAENGKTEFDQVHLLGKPS